MSCDSTSVGYDPCSKSPQWLLEVSDRKTGKVLSTIPLCAVHSRAAEYYYMKNFQIRKTRIN